jgi:hypothetical protein
MTEAEFAALPRVEKDLFLWREIRAGKEHVRKLRALLKDRENWQDVRDLKETIDGWDERLIRLRHERDKVRARS